MGHGSTPVARYRRTNKALLVIWREGLFACREIVESPDRLLSSRLKSASCLSKFTQTWREKPAKPLRLGALFRQNVQT